jgi:hypothetical protein
MQQKQLPNKTSINLISLFLLLFVSNCSEKFDETSLTERINDHTTTEFAKKVFIPNVNPIPFTLVKEKKINYITQIFHTTDDNKKFIQKIYEYVLNENKLNMYETSVGKNLFLTASFWFDEEGKQLKMIAYHSQTGQELVQWISYYNKYGVRIKDDQIVDLNEKIGENIYNYDSTTNIVTEITRRFSNNSEFISRKKFDEKGRIVAKLNSNLSATEVYEYDDVGRLKERGAKYENDLLVESAVYAGYDYPICKTYYEYNSDEPLVLSKMKAEKFEPLSHNILSADSEKQLEFKTWLFRNTAVTEVRFETDWQIWVTLEDYKYTSIENVETIANIIAKWYSQKMNRDYVSCTIWKGKEIYAKSNFNKE